MFDLLACAVVICALLGGVIYFPRRWKKQRTLAMHALAERLGWTFEEAPSLDVIDGYERLELFTTGRRQEIRNHLSGRRGGHAVAVFDFSYKTGTGTGTGSRVWKQTVVQLQSRGMWLPAFTLRPERLLDRAGGLFGSRDIDLAADPEFSRRYLLRGPDEPAIRARFDADVRDFCHRNPGSCAEAWGDSLFFWYASECLPLDETEAQVDAAIDLAQRLARRGALRRSPRVP